MTTRAGTSFRVMEELRPEGLQQQHATDNNEERRGEDVVNPELGGRGGVAGICVSPQIWVPPTHIPRDMCSPTQISLIIMQQWEVFPQGKMFPQVRWLCMG